MYPHRVVRLNYQNIFRVEEYSKLHWWSKAPTWHWAKTAEDCNFDGSRLVYKEYKTLESAHDAIRNLEYNAKIEEDYKLNIWVPVG